MQNVLVTGGSGQLGEALAGVNNAYPDLNIVSLMRKELDITSQANIEKAFRLNEPQVVINAAAYTKVDQAETDKEAAFSINDLGVGHLAKACEQRGIRLVHVSTDFVFDGNQSRPYRPEDVTNPLGVYGASKLAGEQRLHESSCDYSIVRTSWVWANSGNNFARTMLRLGAERTELGVVADQIGTPTYAVDLAHACLSIARKGQRGKVYHFSNEGVASWFDFAVAIMEEAGLNCVVKPIGTSDYPTPARRPHYSVLDKSGIRELLDRPNPHWRQSLRKALSGSIGASRTSVDSTS